MQKKIEASWGDLLIAPELFFQNNCPYSFIEFKQKLKLILVYNKITFHTFTMHGEKNIAHAAIIHNSAPSKT